MKLDDLKVYLPRFLSAESQRGLYEGLKGFPENMDKRIYTNFLENEKVVFQGDGLKDLLVINLPNPEIRPSPGMILSNTCDIDTDNRRNFPANVVYTPVFNLSKYKTMISSRWGKTDEQIEQHIHSIKRQEITQIFYLPAYSDRLGESFVFLDRLNNISVKEIDRQNLKHQRLFTLSDYGAYLFLLKLSIHFTRIQDEVERKSI